MFYGVTANSPKIEDVVITYPYYLFLLWNKNEMSGKKKKSDKTC